jgi:hypothetical protein
VLVLRYTEADLPRPITRKEVVGTLTCTREFDDHQVRRLLNLFLFDISFRSTMC